MAMRIPASCPCWFERTSAFSAGWAGEAEPGGGVTGGQRDSKDKEILRNKWKICLRFTAAFEAAAEISTPSFCLKVSLPFSHPVSRRK